MTLTPTSSRQRRAPSDRCPNWAGRCRTAGGRVLPTAGAQVRAVPTIHRQICMLPQTQPSKAEQRASALALRRPARCDLQPLGHAGRAAALLGALHRRLLCTLFHSCSFHSTLHHRPAPPPATHTPGNAGCRCTALSARGRRRWGRCEGGGSRGTGGEGLGARRRQWPTAALPPGVEQHNAPSHTHTHHSCHRHPTPRHPTNRPATPHLNASSSRGST